MIIFTFICNVPKPSYGFVTPYIIMYTTSHFTYTSLNHPSVNNIYKLSLWMLDEPNCLILRTQQVPKLRYRAHAHNIYISLILQKSMTILNIWFINEG